MHHIVGWGTGKTRIYCMFRLVDKATGEILLERMENGALHAHAPDRDAIADLARDIAKAVEKNW